LYRVVSAFADEAKTNKQTALMTSTKFFIILSSFFLQIFQLLLENNISHNTALVNAL